MKRQRGTAIVEFALVLPVLLVLTFTVTELGRAFYQYNVLAKSVREAARYLAMRAPSATAPGAPAEIAKAKKIIVYGAPNGSGNPVVPGLSLSNVPDPVWGTSGTFPNIPTVTVSVTGYRFIPLAASVFGIRFNNITFSPIRATMRSPT
jgi:hypothetical protein